MAPRGKSSGPKSHIQKCVRCSIVLHETDLAKHDLECFSSEVSFSSPINYPQTPASTAESVVGSSAVNASPEGADEELLPRALSTPSSRGGKDRLDESGGGGTSTPDRSSFKNASYSFNASALNSSTGVTVYGFLDSGRSGGGSGLGDWGGKFDQRRKVVKEQGRMLGIF